MWFTNRSCDKNEFAYMLMVFVVIIVNLTLVTRTLFGEEQISTSGLLVGNTIGIGLLLLIVVIIGRLYSGGCILLNEWWLLITLLVYPLTIVTNQLMYYVVTPTKVIVTNEITQVIIEPVATPVAILPFMFFYPPIALRGNGKKAAYTALVMAMTVVIIGILTYYIAINHNWWGTTLTGNLWDRIYQYTIQSTSLAAFLTLTVYLLPIGFADYYLPGYWIWRYKDTALIGGIIAIITLYMLTYGGILRIITSLTYGPY